MIIYRRGILDLIVAILILSSMEADDSAECVRTCGKNKYPVPFPFGFSGGCQIRLNCSQHGDVLIHDSYRVKNITSETILIDFPAKCNQKIGEIEALSGPNYAMTWRNSLVLRNCTEAPSGCMVPARMVEAGSGLENCGVDLENVRCYSQGDGRSEFIDYASLNRTRCQLLLTSFAVDMGNESGGDPAGSIRFQTAELGWWLPGPSNCSSDAVRTAVRVPRGGEGFRCRCNEGFEGDGFADGGGCRRVPECRGSKNMSEHCGGRNRAGVLAGGIVSGVFVMAALALFCYFLRRRSTHTGRQITTRRILKLAPGRPSVPSFSYRQIERATNGFSDDQRLGTGAYGTVYAGKLPNGECVAVKKIKHCDTDGVEQVTNEIKILSSVSHPNLLRLLGCCIENKEQILVYEYMPNGTLSQHLQREKGTALPWTIRLNIAAETAHAIAYLHSAMNPPIYHRDIKSSNILLDFGFKSKVADFGLSRLGLMDDSHISTAPQGTPGYVDPQYHQNFHLSDKSDVYSFGVVLVEIITALKVVDFSRPNSEVNLAALAIERIGSGRLDDIIDRFVEPNRDAWTLSSIHKVAELAFRCLAFHRDMRPTMKEVADELEQVRLSGWSPLEDNIRMASSVASSSCSSPFDGSEQSGGGTPMRKGGMGSRRSSVLSQRAAESVISLPEVKDCSPISVQEQWPSEKSSPSSNSLLGNNRSSS